MRAVYITRLGPPEALELRDASMPEPRPGEVLVRVRAAGVNFADCLMRMGLYPGAPKPPFVPGYEVAGEVAAVGAGAGEPRLGQRVLAPVSYGGYAEYALARAEACLPVPEGKTFEEAAALPVNYLTAYHALYVLGNLRPGLRVLVHAAAGGVGLAAIQLARLRGAEVYGTASRSKHAALEKAGVAAAIDYSTEDFERRLLELTRGEGVHLILDAVGGRSFRKSWRCLAPTGLLICYGTSSAAPSSKRNLLAAAWSYLSSGLYSPLDMMLSNRGVIGFHLGRLAGEEALLKLELTELHKLWAGGKIQPVVNAAIPAERAAEAHRRLQERRNVGKVVLTF